MMLYPHSRVLAGVTCAVVVTLVAVLSPRRDGQAQDQAWTALGPYAASVQALAIDPRDPSTLYAGAAGVAVFKSRDGGASWQRTGLIDRLGYSAIVLDPRDSGRVYVATSSGFYQSDDGGATWRERSAGLTRRQLHAIALDPANPDTLYLGAWGGVFKSVDGGDTWAAASAGIEASFVVKLAVDPANPATVYAATEAGLYRTANGGASWARIAVEIDDPVLNDLVLDPTAPATLYAATNSKGVFKTVDGGASWAPANVGLPSLLQSFRLALDPARPATLYLSDQRAGVFRSQNGGRSWEPRTAGLPPNPSIYAIAVDSSANTLYAGEFSRGVFRGEGGGETWAAASAGLAGAEISALVLDPTTRVLYAASQTYGLTMFRSDDGGASWEPARDGMMYPVSRALVAHPTDPNTLYAGNSGSLFRTTTGGAMWEPMDSGMDRGRVEVTALALDPSDPDTLYAGTQDGVWKSVDGAASWQARGLSRVTVLSLLLDSSDPATVYAGTERDGVRRTTDGGATWSSTGGGLPAGVAVRALAADPRNTGRIYAGTDRGLYRSDDAGGSWQRAGAALAARSVHAVLAGVGAQAALVVGTNSGVFVSDDGGATWTEMSGGLPAGTEINTLVYDTVADRLYAGGTSGILACASISGCPGAMPGAPLVSGAATSTSVPAPAAPLTPVPAATPQPSPSPQLSPTPVPYPSTVQTFTNSTGRTVNGLRVRVRNAFTVVVTNAPGCTPPRVLQAYMLAPETDIVWWELCVDAGESVTLRFTASSATGPAPSVESYQWLLNGVPVAAAPLPIHPAPAESSRPVSAVAFRSGHGAAVTEADAPLAALPLVPAAQVADSAGTAVLDLADPRPCLPEPGVPDCSAERAALWSGEAGAWAARGVTGAEAVASATQAFRAQAGDPVASAALARSQGQPYLRISALSFRNPSPGPDEFVEVANLGGAEQELSGWSVTSSSGAEASLEEGFVLPPGVACRVYSTVVYPDSCGAATFGRADVWPDDDGEARLVDADGQMVDATAYRADRERQPPPPNLQAMQVLESPDAEVEPALADAIRGRAAAFQMAYAGPCSAARLPDDVGKLCSAVRILTPGMADVIMGLTFSEAAVYVVFARRDGGWEAVLERGRTGRPTSH